MKINWKIAVPSTIALAASAVAIAVPLVIVREARAQAINRLGNFVSLGGAAAKFDKSKKLNVLALGDSDTSGHNGYMANALSLVDGPNMNGNGKRDYVSYADFFAKSLKNHMGEEQVAYKNLAISGNLINDLSRQIITPEVRGSIADANLILLSIGANDLLRVFDVLGRNFWGFIDIMREFTRNVPANASQEVIQRESKRINEMIFNAENAIALKDATFGNEQNTTATATSDVIVEEFQEAFRRFAGILDGTPESVAHVLSIDPHYRDVMLNALRRNLAIIIHDLHVIAPQAQIVVLGHAFPFGQWPKDVIDTPNEGMPLNPSTQEKLSVTTGFQVLLDAMRDGVKISAGAPNDFVDYYNMDEIGKFREIVNGTAVEQNYRRVAPNNATEKFKDENYVKNNLINNAMPNTVDIHPSTFGHDLIGDGLFRQFAPRLGISIDESKIQHSISKFSMLTDAAKLYSPDSPDPKLRLDAATQAALNATPIDTNGNGTAQLSELTAFQAKMQELKLAQANLWYRFDEDIEVLKSVRSNVTDQIIAALNPATGPLSQIKFFGAKLRDYLMTEDAAQAQALATTIVNDLTAFASLGINVALNSANSRAASQNALQNVANIVGPQLAAAAKAKADFEQASANNEEFSAANPKYATSAALYQSISAYDISKINTITSSADVVTSLQEAINNAARGENKTLLAAALNNNFFANFETMRRIKQEINAPGVSVKVQREKYIQYFFAFTKLVIEYNQLSVNVLQEYTRSLNSAVPSKNITYQDKLVLSAAAPALRAILLGNN